jgi:hypothetical protein
MMADGAGIYGKGDAVPKAFAADPPKSSSSIRRTLTARIT